MFNFSKRKIEIFFVSLLAVWFFAGGSVQAAKIFPEVKNYIESGKQFYEIDVSLGTEGEAAGVLTGEIHYSPSDLNFEKIVSGGSIVNLWPEEPKRSSEGKIIFSGGIPNEYKGEKGFIFSAVFSAKNNLPISQTEISFQNCEAYLGGGKGTKIKIADSKSTLDLSTAEKSNIPVDTKPPEVFAPYVTRDKNLAEEKWVVIASAQDKGFGIDHYEIFESAKRYDKEKIKSDRSIGWKTVQGIEAYILEDQSLESYIYVKAVDKAGNIRVAEVIPVHDQKSRIFEYKALAFTVFLIIAVAIFLKLFIFKKGNRK